MNDLVTFITVNNEPRVLDVSLSTELVVARLSYIRAIIRERKDELEQLGGLHMAGETEIRGGRIFRETQRYFLNEAQALLVGRIANPSSEECVQANITQSFDAYRREGTGAN
jgi:hypothetical protein